MANQQFYLMGCEFHFNMTELDSFKQMLNSANIPHTEEAVSLPSFEGGPLQLRLIIIRQYGELGLVVEFNELTGKLTDIGAYEKDTF